MSRLLFSSFETTTPPPAPYTPPLSLVAYWGPHFPDVGGGFYWSRHFPDGAQSPSNFGGYGPPGIATLALDIEDGFTITYSWATDIIQRRNGSEQRISTVQRPKQSYKGTAKLLSQLTRQARARLARYAASGSVFLLGLPHEALTLQADSLGFVVTVSSTFLALADWAQVGQRVVIRSRDLSQSIDAVIQSASGSQITLDVSPGAVGKAGALIMPAMAVYLDAQQDFARYRTNVEAWSIDAHAAIFDYALPRGSIDLGTVNAAWAGAVIVARNAGVAGNLRFRLLSDPSATVTGDLDETASEVDITIRGGVTTLGQLAATLQNTSSFVTVTGAFAGSAVISDLDVFETSLAGGSAIGAMGNGAALTFYAGHPVWDRGIQNDDTNSDPVQAMTELVDLGGIPVALGHADAPAGGRAVAMSGTWPEFQWLKLFLATVRGQQRMWWLSTDRDDFTFVSAAGATLTVRSDDESDIDAHFPKQRDRLQIVHTDATVEYVQILSYVDNGNGTLTMTLAGALASTSIRRVSWLDPAHFDSDTFEITFTAGGFSFP